jgi:hypothetical protein
MLSPSCAVNVRCDKHRRCRGRVMRAAPRATRARAPGLSTACLPLAEVHIYLLPHLHPSWARRCHICAGTWLAYTCLPWVDPRPIGAQGCEGFGGCSCAGLWLAHLTHDRVAARLLVIAISGVLLPIPKIHTHTHTRAREHKRAHTHKHTHTHARAHTRTHTHTPPPPPPPPPLPPLLPLLQQLNALNTMTSVQIACTHARTHAPPPPPPPPPPPLHARSPFGSQLRSMLHLFPTDPTGTSTAAAVTHPSRLRAERAWPD